MGIICEYFTAVDDERAVSVIHWPNGPSMPDYVSQEPSRAGWPGWTRRAAKRRAIPWRPPIVIDHEGVGATTACFNGFLPTYLTDFANALKMVTDGTNWSTGDVEPRVLAEHHDGESWVFAVSPALTRSLVTLDTPVIQAACERWVLVSDDLDRDDVDSTTGAMCELAALARTATENGHRLYCWTCM